MRRVPLLCIALLLGCNARPRTPHTPEETYSASRAKLDQAQTALERFYALRRVAKAAVDVGKLDEAQALAHDLLAAATMFPKDWNYGNAIHDGHLVLGRVALRRGDVGTAKQELLAAGHTPGSPQLDSFGPNMTLARDLLERGEKQVVLDYFVLCSRFWQDGSGELQAWRAAIEHGSMPEFGANLRY